MKFSEFIFFYFKDLSAIPLHLMQNISFEVGGGTWLLCETNPIHH